MASRGISIGGNAQQSVIVTGDGNQVSLRFGDSGLSLPLIRRHHPPPDRRRIAAGGPPRELDLLKADAGLLPLLGRAAELAQLQAWAEDAQDVFVHGLIGRAGSGKTRLAIECCARLDPDRAAPGASGWVAGFLNPADLDAVVETLATHRLDWPVATLLVIDDAASGSKPLARWLDRLAAEEFPGKLRVLLLDRAAPEGFGWWHDLVTPASDSVSSRGDLFLTPRPQHLPDLTSADQRRALFFAARQSARSLHGQGSEPAADSTETELDQALAAPDFGNPLALVMAGAIAADRPVQEALHVRRLDAARMLGRREIARFRALGAGRGVDAAASDHVLAFNTFVGGLPLADLPQTIAAELQAAGLTANAGMIAALLQQEWAVDGRSPDASDAPPRLASVTPDLIGEAVIVEILLEGAPATQAAAAAVAARAVAAEGDEGGAMLVRLAQDYGYPVEDPTASDAERATAHKVLKLVRDCAEILASEDESLLFELSAAIPGDTLVLGEMALDITKTICRAVRGVVYDEDPEGRVLLADVVNDLSVRLMALGRHEEALTAAEEAAALLRSIINEPSDAFTSSLISTLNNIANNLGDMGRHEEALVAAEEALALGRALAAAQPEAFEPALAMSLATIAASLGELGRVEEALAAAEEAVARHRALAAAKPDAFRPKLAVALDRLARCLNRSGRVEEALAAAEEGAAICRGLAAEKPDISQPALAYALYTLAMRHRAAGREAHALAVAEEAVALFRLLAAALPETFKPELAKLLGTLAAWLGDVGRFEDALAASMEAVAHFRDLAESRPDAFEPHLARSLHTLDIWLADAGQLEGALAAIQEAVRLRRKLAAAQPGAFSRHLAGSLYNLAIRLNDLGRWEEALAVAEEAVEVRRTLAEAEPDRLDVGLTRALSFAADLSSFGGQHEDALAAAEEALSICRALAGTRPDAFASDLASALSTLGDVLERQGRIQEAVVHDREAIAQFASGSPDETSGMETALRYYVETYLRRAEAAGIAVDGELLARLPQRFDGLGLAPEDHDADEKQSTDA